MTESNSEMKKQMTTKTPAMQPGKEIMNNSSKSVICDAAKSNKQQNIQHLKNVNDQGSSNKKLLQDQHSVKKYLLHIILPVIFFMCTLTASAQTNLGDATLESGTGARVAGNIEAWDKFTTSVSYKITSFALYQNVAGGTGTMHVGLYADNGSNSPSTAANSLVSGSDGSAITLSGATGWITYSITPFTLPAGTYWIATNFSANSPTNWSRKAATGTHVYKLSVGFATLPSSWPSGSTSEVNGPVSMYFIGCQTPAITAMASAPCSGSTFTVPPVDGTNGVVPAGTTYSWSAPSGTGFSGGAAGSGASNISGTLTNTTNTAQTATYTVTPTSGSCPGSAFTVTITVNPKPVIANKTTTVCSGSAFSVSPTNGTDIVPLNTTYTWTAPTVTGGITGGSAQATGQSSISQTLTNPTNVAQTATYTVTPTSGATGSCPGSTFTVTVTVNAIPAASATKTDISCFNANDGTITVSGSGGSGTYSFFSINNGGSYQTSNIFSPLPIGVYQIRVKDSNGCESKSVQ